MTVTWTPNAATIGILRNAGYKVDEYTPPAELRASLADWLTPGEDDELDGINRQGEQITRGLMNSNDVLTKNASGGGRNARVRAETEKYPSTGRQKAYYTSGQPVMMEGKHLEYLSQRESALSGVWFKNLMIKRGCWKTELSEHEKGLLNVAAHECDWIHAEKPGLMRGDRVKALLDDSTSGGQEIVPEFFDFSLVTQILLHSEIMPWVTIREMSHGSSVESALISHPTVSWSSQPEGTAESLFNTAGLIADISQSAFHVSVHVEIGRDFQADAAPTLGGIINRLLGKSLASDLDNQLMNGDGTTEIQGVLNATGIVQINTGAGTAGPASVGDVEQLIFALDKQYRQRSDSSVSFVSNDNTYRHLRSVSIGAGDQRRVFGMDHEAYTLMDRPYRIQNDIANGTVVFSKLRAYVLWRRMGMRIEATSEGEALRLRNTSLVSLRARYAGQQTDATKTVAFANDFPISSGTV